MIKKAARLLYTKMKQIWKYEVVVKYGDENHFTKFNHFQEKGRCFNSAALQITTQS